MLCYRSGLVQQKWAKKLWMLFPHITEGSFKGMNGSKGSFYREKMQPFTMRSIYAQSWDQVPVPLVWSKPLTFNKHYVSSSWWYGIWSNGSPQAAVTIIPHLSGILGETLVKRRQPWNRLLTIQENIWEEQQCYWYIGSGMSYLVCMQIRSQWQCCQAKAKHFWCLSCPLGLVL